FHALQDKGTKGIGQIDDQHPDHLAALVAKRAGKNVRPVAKALDCVQDLLLGLFRDIASEGRLIQNQRHGGRRKTAGPRHIHQSHTSAVWACPGHLLATVYWFDLISASVIPVNMEKSED